ncbi:MAG TPA: glycine oxidase ThiO [Acidimicrobiales bacterium]|nr:glycine oxidase ThiO [Acidimicrobiales bacterium]
MTRSPMKRDLKYDVVVVGAGVIGLACAWLVARTGRTVAIVDPDPGKGATWAAAGMLAPVTEVHFGEEQLLQLGLAGARRWPKFVSELEADAGLEVGYEAEGTLLVGSDSDDREWLARLYQFQKELGLSSEWITARAARSLAPALAPGIRAAMWVRDDHQVDNRLLVTALLAANESRGVALHRARVSGVELGNGSVSGVRIEEDLLGKEDVFLGGENVVLAAGCLTGQIAGLPENVEIPTRPVKGQILRLRPRRSSGSVEVRRLLGHTVRGYVQGTPVYLVQRADGSVVVGSTVEEVGFDTTVTAGAVYEMLRDAHRLVPGVTELVFDEAIARLRPGSPDNGPIVGPVTDAEGRTVGGLVVATGHFRHGILLAPITAEAVLAALDGTDEIPQFKPFHPARFGSPSGLAC